MADPVVVEPGNPPEPTPTVSGAGDWFESLPPDLKVEKSIQSFKGKGVADVAKSYVEAQKMIGGSIRLPKPDATPEDREAFLADLSTKLGRPATAADYKKAITLEALPDGTPWDEGVLDEVLSDMHKAHATPAQVSAAVNGYRKALAKGMAARASQEEQADKELRGEWGDRFERNLSRTNSLLKDIGGQKVVDIFRERIGYNPTIVKFLDAIAAPLEEMKIITPDVPGATTENDAQAKIDAIYSNMADPYWKLSAEKQADVMRELHRQSTGAKGRQVVATFG